MNRYLFFTWSWVQDVLTWLFMLAIGLGIARLVLLCGLALIGRNQEKKRHTPSDAGDLSVTVLIPAFNEEKVICSSIQRILASTHQNLNVIVIDDGSADGTSDAVRTSFSEEAEGGSSSQPRTGARRRPSISAWRAPRATSWLCSTPTPNSSPPPYRGSCAGSPIPR